MNRRNDHLGHVLLIGGSGMLGRAWRQVLERHGTPFCALNRPQIDLADDASIRRAVRDSGCGLVINAAGYTNVDGAEREPQQATLINATAVGVLADTCAQAGATLLHYSTDYVFDGQATQPYHADSVVRPINAYGASKAEGEAAIRDSGCDHLIIRTSWLYAPWGTNFVRTMLGLMATRDVIRVVNDQRGRPTSAQSLADISWRLYQAGTRGTHHVTGGGEPATWFDFTREIARLTDSPCRIEPCTTAEFPRPARRPAYSVLDLSLTEKFVGPIMPWQQQLAAVIDQLTATANASASPLPGAGPGAVAGACT